MHITTVMNLVILTGIAILLIKYMVSKFDIVLRMGVQIVIILLLILLIRMLFPLKHPFIITIDISKYWPEIHMFLIEPRISLFGDERSLLDILVTISFIVSIVLGINLLISYLAIKITVRAYKPVEDNVIKQALDELNSKYKRPVEFRIVENEGIASPFLFGLCRPYIVLPTNITFDKDEWSYILKHEITHFYNRDIWIKLISQIVQALYWWNPFIHILNKQIYRLQEVRVDSAVIRNLPPVEAVKYMQCLLDVYEYGSDLMSKKCAAAFIDSRCQMEVRFLHLSNRLLKKTLNKYEIIGGVLIYVFLLMVTFGLPNVIMFEPYGMNEEDTTGTFEADLENTYMILTSEGLYELYIDGKHVYTFYEPIEGIEIIE